MGKKNLPSQLTAMDSSRRARRGVTDDSMDSERKRFPGEFLCELDDGKIAKPQLVDD